MSSVYRQPDDLWWADAVVTGPARQWQSWWQRQWHLVGGSPPGRLARQQGFVVATWQLPAFGWQPHDLRREIRRGQWSSPAFGVASPIVVGATGEYLDRRREHVLAAAGGVLLRRDHVISARSAAIAAGLPTLSVPRRPELTELARETLGRRSRAHVFGAVRSRGRRDVVRRADHADRADGRGPSSARPPRRPDGSRRRVA
jgi:hypothetical protein